MAAQVDLTRKGRVLWITLDEPKRFNAMGLGTVKAIHQALDNEAMDPEVRVVVFTGAGGHFSAGGDVREFPDSDMGMWTFQNRFIEMFNRVRNYALPTIAAIEGNCVGGALELALSCDIRISTRGARIGDPDIKLGTPGGTQRLIRTVPAAVAKYMLFTGTPISPDDAVTYGILNSVHDTGDEMRAAVTDAAERIAAMPPLAIAATKRLVNHGASIPDFETATYFENEVVFRASKSEEYTEGVASFMEKRPAAFPNDTSRFR